MLAFSYHAQDVYLAAQIHESGLALAAKIDLEYKIGTKSTEKEGVWDYTFEHIATLQLGMKISVGPNEEGPYYFLHARVGYEMADITEDTTVTDMAQ